MKDKGTLNSCTLYYSYKLSDILSITSLNIDIKYSISLMHNLHKLQQQVNGNSHAG